MKLNYIDGLGVEEDRGTHDQLETENLILLLEQFAGFEKRLTAMEGAFGSTWNVLNDVLDLIHNLNDEVFGVSDEWEETYLDA